MANMIATFQDLTLGFDGSASLRYLKTITDASGNAIWSEPHRLTIQPDTTDVLALVQAQNNVLTNQMGFAVQGADALATYVANTVTTNRADPAVAAAQQAWIAAAAAAKAQPAA